MAVGNTKKSFCSYINRMSISTQSISHLTTFGMFPLRRSRDMLRVSLLCLACTIVRSQTCVSVSAVYAGGLCDGTKVSMTKCMSVDQAAATPTPLNGSRFTTASCQSDTADVCLALRGSLNPDYCRTSPETAPFCRNLAVATAAAATGLCTSDAHCKTIVVKICRSSGPDANGSNASASAAQCNTTGITLSTRPRLNVLCCADIKAVVTQACTGVDLSALDTLMDAMRDARECALYPNCTSAALSVPVDVPFHAAAAGPTSAAAPSACTATLLGILLLLLFVFVEPQPI